jgi:aspartate ammonia-lyase
MEGKTIREAALQERLFTEEELDIIFTPQELTRPGIAGSKSLKRKKEKQ